MEIIKLLCLSRTNLICFAISCRQHLVGGHEQDEDVYVTLPLNLLSDCHSQLHLLTCLVVPDVHHGTCVSQTKVGLYE